MLVPIFYEPWLWFEDFKSELSPYFFELTLASLINMSVRDYHVTKENKAPNFRGSVTRCWKRVQHYSTVYPEVADAVAAFTMYLE